MSNTVRRLLTCAALAIVGYFAVSLIATLAQLANAAELAFPGSGRPLFWGLTAVFTTLLAAPIVLWRRLPKPLQPPTEGDPAALAAYRAALLVRLAGHPLLAAAPPQHADDLPAALAVLDAEAERLVKETAGAVFVSTAVMQNGRLDGLVVLLSQLRLVWRIAAVYRQRPSPRELLTLYAQVGGSVLVADSVQEIDFAELSTPIVTAVFPSLQGGIPGLQGVSALLVNSLANGAANAFLTLRVGLLAKAYCGTLAAQAASEVRRSASAEALSLVGGIVKAHGQRIAQRAWGLFKDSLSQATEATLHGTKAALTRTADATGEGVRQVGRQFGHGWKRVKGVLK